MTFVVAVVEGSLGCCGTQRCRGGRASWEKVIDWGIRKACHLIYAGSVGDGACDKTVEGEAEGNDR
jgi:hypothetical protein